MLSARLGRVTAPQLRRFYFLLGSALASRLLIDEQSGIWRVHNQELFPWRHLPGLPLYPTWMLAIEWALLAASAAGLLWGHWVKAALRVALLALAMGLSQRYANQNALLFLVLAFANLEIPTLPLPTARVILPNVGLLRMQLFIVYGFSVVNKIVSGFLSGETLSNLFAFPRGLAAYAAPGAVAAELIIPALLWFGNPGLGFIGAALLHGLFAWFMPSVWPFSLTMLALAVLFVPASV
ncbi:MAG TPA: hypothetical protein VL137_07300 [Polyangiaceae bacterium]|nr:hypothetical protein [Polyangiaceae bacterium]